MGLNEEVSMSASMTFGGWVTSSLSGTCSSDSSRVGYGRESVERASTSTNVSSGFVRWLGCVAAAGAALTVVGTGGERSIEQFQRSAHQMHHMAPTVEVTEVAPVRVPAEDLARIREVLKPAVSDIAATVGVSRQSVYNWLNGEPVADENAAKLKDLALAADVLAPLGAAVNAGLLKRKFANGRTLMQVSQAGESARNAALQLMQIHKRESAQRERIAARFSNRAKTAPSADFDLPLANDPA
jgi:transcriptional regulator with XRE-family HTH domain